MITCPRSSRILCVLVQHEPENNKVKIEALKKIIHLYKRVDTFIHDRNCKFQTTAEKEKDLSQIEFYPIDKFHAKKHVDHCLNNPYEQPHLMKRLEGLSTSISEQIFAWFRGYARIFNEMRERRHKFIVHLTPYFFGA